MIIVLQRLASEISDICDIGAEWVSDKTKFPYATYTYAMTESDERQDTTLNIDVWDRSKSAATVENLSKQIIDRLNKKVFKTNECSIWVYFERQQTFEGNLSDKNPLLKRRRVVFNIHKYDIGE